ncbi:TonB family protein [uncultured Pseudodesulfovibrio sp.]|uniref:TonB family protein n=1 Tax=uncultured Pseudodesulfovibrio sp. TaxID=2035858 RepID=UPI0029C6CA78|nr:TonB family protein [uncultured Pseudodesulfovibrio sp.]
MTSRQLFGLCIAISICIHFLLVQQNWAPEPVMGSDQIVIPADFDIAVSTPGNALALEQGMEENNDGENAEETARRLKRLAIKHYLKQVNEAIERRKFLPGNGDLSDLIGNVLYTFRIRPDDSFSGIRLVRSSGNARLDQAAGRAIAAASGVTKRPKILRGQAFSLKITVKYQYSM